MAGLVLDLGQQDRLAAENGARVIQLPSGCMPMISECACCAICLTMFARYLDGIQSRGSILRSRAMVSSKWASRSCSVVIGSALLGLTSLHTDHSVIYSMEESLTSRGWEQT